MTSLMVLTEVTEMTEAHLVVDNGGDEDNGGTTTLVL